MLLDIMVGWGTQRLILSCGSRVSFIYKMMKKAAA